MNFIRSRSRVINVVIYVLMIVLLLVFGFIERRGQGAMLAYAVIAWIIGFIGLLAAMPKDVNPKYFATLNTLAELFLGLFAAEYFDNQKILPMIMILQWLVGIMVVQKIFMRFLAVTQISFLLIINYFPLLLGYKSVYSHVEIVLYCLFIGTANWISRHIIESFVQAYDELEEQRMSMDEVFKLLKEKNIEAQKATKSKTAFLSNMSHEIRTPINSIIGMNEMILRSSGEKETLEYANTIKSASQMLLALVNDTLDFSKIESGKMEIVETKYDLSSVIHDIYSIFNIKMDEKGLAFQVEVDPDLPIGLIGDNVRLRQVITNLMTNALKYTDAGTIYLKIHRCQNLSSHTVKLRISVEDTGTGIAKKDLSRLKEKFVRLNLERNNDIEGTGLGISIVNGYLELMNSALQIESEPGVGSKFYFDIVQGVYDFTPIGEFANYNIFSKKDVYVQSFIAPDARLLVVDDNQANLKVFEGLLKGLQCHIDTALNGEKAIKNASKTKYDLIFMDHMMPVMDGVMTFHNIRQLCEINKDTPVFVLTANAVAGAEQDYMNEGFTGYLTKPIVPQKLEKTVHDNIAPELVIEISESVRDGVTDRQIQKDDLSELPRVEGIDWDYAYSHFNDVNLLSEIVKDFIATLASFVNELRDYYEAIVETQDEQKLHLFEVRIHSMKSAATMIGLLPIAGTAATLEYAARDRRLEVIIDMTPAFLAECERYQMILSDAFFKNDSVKISDWSVDEVVKKFDLLEHETQQFNIRTMDDAMNAILQYEFSDDVSLLVTNLRGYVANLEVDKITETTNAIKAILTKSE